MRTNQLHQGLLMIGFLVLVAAILVANSNPATGYEISIYTGTPIIVWVGVCFSLFIALGLAFTRKGTIQWLALFLAGKSFLVIIMLPLFRGYYHLGEGDTMSHVGAIRDLSTGSLNPIDLGYPAVHLIVLFITETLDISISQASYYTVYAFIILFVVFLPLTVRLLMTNWMALPIGLFSAILLLPINLISVHMNIHPTSQAILFICFILYIFISYIRSNDHRYAIIFPIVSLTLISLHPQQAANFLLLLGTAGLAQITGELLQRDNQKRKRTAYIQAGFFMVIFWLWFESSRFVGSFTRFLASLFEASQTSAEAVNSRSASLTEIGSSPEELFLKLFLVSFVYCIIAGGYLISVLVAIFLKEEKSSIETMLYLIAGLFPISLLFIMYVIADITTQYFRHLGFIMVIITVIGSIGLGHFTQKISSTETTARVVIVSIFLVFLSLSLLVIYPSPYIYQNTGHVPQGQINGYENAVNHQREGIVFLWTRSNVGRYDDFSSGTTTSNVEGAIAPNHFADQNLANRYNEPKYLMVTSNDRELDLGLYNGFRYSRDDFQYLQTHSTISRVRSNGDFELYLVDANRQDRGEANNHISQTQESKDTT